MSRPARDRGPGAGGAGRGVLAIGGVNLRRFGRDRGNIFFVFIFPIALILVIGLQFQAGGSARLGVVGGEGDLAGSLLAQLGSDEDVELVAVGTADELGDRVASTDLDAGVVLPPDLDEVVEDGTVAHVEVVVAETAQGQRLRNVVDQALSRAVAVPTAAAVAVEHGADPAEARAAAEARSGVLSIVSVRSTTAGDRLFPEDIGGYDVAAPSQLVLFLFLTGVSGSYALIQTRQLGVSRRMLASPTSVRTIILGEALGRFLIGLVQALYVLVVTLVLFGVDWGDPLGATAVVLSASAASAGLAMCFGTVFSQPEQASGVGTVVALCLAALGGAMLPIELFGDTLASVARATPHYWAIDAFAELVRHDGSILDIGSQLAVLVGFAVLLLLLAAWRMRVVLTRP